MSNILLLIIFAVCSYAFGNLNWAIIISKLKNKDITVKDIYLNEIEKIKEARKEDVISKTSTVGPHRDDFSFMVGDVDIRKFGSQGQQRSCALSLKLSEIELVTLLIGDTPVLMLDDVLSELDSGRQQYLLESIGGIQTFITCTGLDEFVRNRFEIDRVFRIQDGMAFPETTEEDKVPTAFEEE